MNENDEIQMIKAKWIPIDQIEENKGQINGVPANPRKVSAKKFSLLKKSIQEDPEMLGLRELIVFPIGGGEENETDTIRYVAIGGNQRLKALKKLGYDSAPCKILPKDMPAEKLASIAAKDNGHVGVWDIDPADIDGWDIDLLKDWGANIKKEDTEASESGEVEFSEILNEEHNYLVLYFDNEVDWLQAQTLFDIKTVKSGSTRKDGELPKRMEIRGTGRVLKGSEAINKILSQK